MHQKHVMHINYFGHPDNINEFIFHRRLSETSLGDDEKRKISEIFYGLQKESLADVIRSHGSGGTNPLLQITTFSRLLTEGGRRKICHQLGQRSEDVQMITLQQITTEEQFAKRVNHFLIDQSLRRDTAAATEQPRVLIVQGGITPDTPHSLVESVRYAILNQILQMQQRTQNRDNELAPSTSPFCIMLVLQVPRCHGGLFSGFPGGRWQALHVDELCGDPHLLNVAGWSNRTLHHVLETSNKEDGLDVRRVVAEAIQKAASLAFSAEQRASPRILRIVEILSKCFTDSEQVGNKNRCS